MSTNIWDIKFLIRKNKAKGDLAPVYARINIDGVPADVSLKRYTNIETWCSTTGRSKGKRDEDKAFNSFLDKVRADMGNCFAELKYQKKAVTAQAVKSLYCGEDPASNEQSLNKLIDYHNNHLKHTIEWGTMKNYMTTQKYIQAFIQKNYKAADIPLSKLSYSFLVDFEIFLRQHKPADHHKPCGHNTVLKHIERLRKMINVAMKNEWIEKDPFSKFQGRFIRKDRDFLSQEEVDRIEEKEFRIERLSWARDLFIFSCYTGLAYCDVMSLKEQNVSLGIDGEYWITTERKKTHQAVRLPLLPKALEIIKKYKDHPRAVVSGTLFATLSNQKLNSYLKEIADLCQVDKNLTFHLARHTFATTITLTNGVPIETVSKILGHTTIKTTQIYAKVVEKKVSQDMGALRRKLAGDSKQRELKISGEQ